ncbi:BTB/POZ domain-containing protein [Phaeosphaeriaceae sp. PMI808]|nr:BTB/POZ domain-containing protein [Phaeosphaeriaceae sp. PMI808]
MATAADFEPLIRNLPSFFDSEGLSDGVIKCGKREFRIHRLVLCAQSSYFTKVFTGDFKESNGCLTLNDDDISAVEAMLEFMYSFDYDSSGRAENTCSPMVFNVKVYSIAEKYDIPALKAKAKQKFETAVETCWEMDDFPDAVKEVYHSIPDNNQELQEVVADIACRNIKQLLFKDKFCDVLKETGGFASSLVHRLGVDRVKTYLCPHCGKKWKGILSEKGKNYYCMLCSYANSTWGSYEEK